MNKTFWEFYRRIKNLPKMVRIEACSLCQLDCSECYMRNKRENSPIIGNGYLTAENFKNFIKKNKYIKYIELSLSGEIFLNPELNEIMKIANQNNIILTAFNGVNFNTVNENLLENLVKYKFFGLTISIDGATQQTYSQYRKKGSLDKVFENIKKLNFFKEKYKSIFPILKWQYILFDYNKHEVNQAISTARELNFAIFQTKRAWNSDFSEVKEEKFIPIIEFEPEVRKIILMNNIQVCSQPYIQPQINWDGRLLGCCYSVYNDLGVNVFNTNLEKSLKYAKMQFMKDVLEGKKTADSSLACYKCELYKQRTRLYR